MMNFLVMGQYLFSRSTFVVNIIEEMLTRTERTKKESTVFGRMEAEAALRGRGATSGEMMDAPFDSC